MTKTTSARLKNNASPLSTGSSQRIAVSDFVEKITESLHEGYRVLPFVGAGLSQPSGIPTVKELQRYLTYCFWLMMGAPNARKLQVINGALWRPNSPKDWPRMGLKLPVANPKGLWDTIDLKTEIHDYLQSVALTKDDKRTGPILEAYGALANWRSALQLLSRVSRAECNKEGELSLTLSIADNSVIDSFFFRQVNGKEPNLGHRVLVALAPFLRANVIFTTNFDDLIEKAFLLSGIPLNLFEMPQPASAPSDRLVLANPALLKLHGGRFGLRADYSIDSPPSRTDRWNFLGYLAGCPIDEDRQQLPEIVYKERKKFENRVALLFTGVSASDERTRALVKLAYGTFSNLRVFWLCFSPNDLETVHKLERECAQAHGCSVSQPFSVLHSTDHPLVMLQLYQRCALSIPTSGIFYPALLNVRAHPVLSPVNIFRKQIDEYSILVKDRVRKQLEKSADDQEPINNQPVVISVGKDVYGGITLASELCEKNDWSVDQNYVTRSVWINLDEVVRPAGVLMRLALQITRYRGIQDPISSIDLDDFDNLDPKRVAQFYAFRDKLESIVAEATISLGVRWVVFLNGQEGIGTHPIFEPNEKNGAWDNLLLVNRLAETLEYLTRSSRTGISFVIILRNSDKTPTTTFLDRWSKEPIEIHRDLTHFNRKAVVRNAISLIRNKRVEGWFVYLVTFFRTARFSASLARISCRFRLQEAEDFTQEVCDTRLFDTTQRVNIWIKRLEKTGVVRFLPGDLIWMNQGVRADLIEGLKRMRRNLPLERRINLGALVSRWQGRLLLGSSDPLAAWECGVSAMDAVTDWCDSTSRPQTRNVDKNLELACQILRHFQQVLHTSRKLLLLRLSNNFADRALMDLEKRLKPLRLKATHPSLAKVVRSVGTDLRRLRIWLYLQEGEYQKVQELCDTRQLQLFNANRQIEAKLHFSAALLCQRDYNGAQQQIEWSFKRLRFSSKRLNLLQAPDRAARHWLSEGGNLNIARRKNLILAARRMCYLKLHVSQADYLDTNQLSQGRSLPRLDRTAKRSQTVREAIAWASFALELLRSIENVDGSYVFVQNIRLRSHMALAMALQEVCDRKRERKKQSLLTNSQAVMGDAQAFVEEFPLPHSGIEIAVLELRKAEIELLRVGSENWFKELRKIGFGDVAVPRLNRAQLEPAIARIYDSFARLSRAQDILFANRKNRWWWWLFTTLKLKASEYLYTIRIGWMSIEEGEYIRTKQTVPPVVRDFCRYDLKQLVEEHRCNDTFLLARMVHSYGNTVKMMVRYRLFQEKQSKDETSTSTVWSKAGQWLDVYRYLKDKLREELQEIDGKPIYGAVLNYARDCYINAEKKHKQIVRFIADR